jgi:hypothetical protein
MDRGIHQETHGTRMEKTAARDARGKGPPETGNPQRQWFGGLVQLPIRFLTPFFLIRRAAFKGASTTTLWRPKLAAAIGRRPIRGPRRYFGRWTPPAIGESTPVAVSSVERRHARHQTSRTAPALGAATSPAATRLFARDGLTWRRLHLATGVFTLHLRRAKRLTLFAFPYTAINCWNWSPPPPTLASLSRPALRLFMPFARAALLRSFP